MPDRDELLDAAAALRELAGGDGFEPGERDRMAAELDEVAALWADLQARSESIGEPGLGFAGVARVALLANRWTREALDQPSARFTRQQAALQVTGCLRDAGLLRPPDGPEQAQPGDVVTIGVTESELALLEANAWAEHPGFDRLAAKIKAARAGRPAAWPEYLTCDDGGPGRG